MTISKDPSSGPVCSIMRAGKGGYSSLLVELLKAVLVRFLQEAQRGVGLRICGQEVRGWLLGHVLPECRAGAIFSSKTILLDD